MIYAYPTQKLALQSVRLIEESQKTHARIPDEIYSALACKRIKARKGGIAYCPECGEEMFAAPIYSSKGGVVNYKWEHVEQPYVEDL